MPIRKNIPMTRRCGKGMGNGFISRNEADSKGKQTPILVPLRQMDPRFEGGLHQIVSVLHIAPF
jgi:hypothetical protein